MSMTQSAPLWNSLEIFKLFLGFLTPFFVAIGGYYITKSMRKLEARVLVSQKVVERRLELFDKMAPLLNDMYCYFKQVGQWKELTPPDLITNKRTLDKLFYVNKPLFSAQFEAKYFAFIMDDCFKPYTGQGHSARLRCSHLPYAALPGWKSEWTEHFVEDVKDMCKFESLEADYQALMRQFAIEIGIVH